MNTLFLVDDDSAMLRIYQMHLRRLPCRCHFFKTGQEALHALEQHPPDLAVLDYDLPDMKGSQLLEKIRAADSSFQNMPVIFITGQGKKEVHDDLLRQGARKVLSKPFSPSGLVSEIKQLLEMPG